MANPNGDVRAYTTETLNLLLSVARMKTCITQIKKNGKSSNHKLVVAPAAKTNAHARAIRGGATAQMYIDRTEMSARLMENFTPENQFFVLHSHISRKFVYMRVLTRR